MNSETGGGIGNKPQLAAAQSSVSVGTVDVGSTSTAVSVIISNTGSASASLTATPSGVGIAATGCTGTLAAGASCTLSITATPTTPGDITGAVTVSATGANAVTIQVTGKAVPKGNFTLDKTVIDLGNLAVGQTVQAVVTVTAGSALTGLATGIQGADLKVDATSTCTTSLAAGASCTVVVNFTGMTAGAASGDYVVVSQGGVTKTVSVMANVLTLAKLAATPTSLSFATAPGTTSSPVVVNVGNIGGLPSGQLAVAVTGTAFKVTAETCSVTTLAAGATCAVTVVYAPAATATTAETANLTITDGGAAKSVATVSLTGTPNLPSSLTISPASADLGSVAPGVAGTETVFTITNTSATPSGAIAAAVSSASVVISTNTCASKATLNKSETCTIGVKLSPAAGVAPAAVSALLTATPAAGAAVSAQLTGAIITGASLTAAPTSISFGSIPVNQSSTPVSVTITNAGATATGTLSVALAGTGSAQVAITGSTCTGSLAPAKTCTVSVQYSPTDTTGVNGTVTVTDGSASASVVMVGTGLAPTPFTVNPTKITFADMVLGYDSSAQSLTLALVSGATTDSGTITTAISGTDAADFSVSADNTDCTLIQPGQTCTIAVVFKPTAVGSRTATLEIKGSKGGLYSVALSGKALPLVEIEPTGCATIAGVATDIADDKGIGFGDATLSRQGATCGYIAHVRGATAVTATTTTISVALATSTPPDFRNVLLSSFPGGAATPTATDVNPCSGKALGLTANSGVATGTNPTNWSKVGNRWECTFYVQFYPQTSKGDKTATVTATATAGGTSTQTLSGTAVGSLTISPKTHDFGTINSGVGSSENTGTTLTLNTSSDTGLATFTVTNNGVAAEGPISIAVGGANAGDFGVVEENCTDIVGGTLPGPDTNNPGVNTCTITVAFAPTSAGAKTATLTVTAATSGETTSATLTGNGGTPQPLTIAPATGAFPDTAQNNKSAFATYTISNPAGGALSGKLTYGIDDCSQAAHGDFELFAPTATAGYPANACGANNTKQLDPGASCTLQVRFMPSNATVPGDRTGQTLKVCDAGSEVLSVDLSGKATSQLTLSGTALSVVDNATVADFGNVGKGSNTSVTFTVTNNGLDQIGSLSLASIVAPFTVASDSVCTNGGALGGGTSCALKVTVTVPTNATTALTLASTIGASPVSAAVTLKATPVDQPHLALYGITGNDAAHPIEFGSVPINSTATNGSGVITVWFTNDGGLPATALSQTLTETNADSSPDGFSLAAENPGTCAGMTTLAKGGVCSVNLRLKPTTTGAKTATFALSGTTGGTVNVYLHGTATGTTPTGLYAVVVGTTDTVGVFPSTAIAANPASKVYLELHNPTGSTLTDQVVVFSSTDFTMTAEKTGSGTACTMSDATHVTVGTICQVALNFSPAGPWAVATRYRYSSVSIGGSILAGAIGQVQQPAKLQLSATGSATVTVDATAETVDFGQVLEAGTSSVVFTIKNIGEAATAGGVALTLDTAAQAYLQVASTTCPTGSTKLAAGDTCTATVAVIASLDVAGGAGTGGIYDNGEITAASTTVSELSDEAYQPIVRIVRPAALKLTSTATACADTYVGATQASCAVLTLTNGATSGETSASRQDSGTVSLTLSNTTKDFSIVYSGGTAPCVPGVDGTFKLAGGQSCNATVKFSPKSVASLTTDVTLAATPGGSAKVTITGKGLGDLVMTSSGSGSGTTADPYQVGSSAVTFSITNYGGSATKTLHTSVGGTNASLFVVVKDTCYGQMLPANGICTVDVVFVGTVNATTAQTAALTVTDGSTTNVATGSLKAVNPS